MLSVKPSERPTILEILNKMIVRRRVTQYMEECLNGPRPELASTDVDDMYQDSLKDQAEKLQIPGFAQQQDSRLQMQGALNPKKLREAKVIQTNEDKQRELLRLKKELEEKERIEKKIRDLEEEAKKKEK